MLVPGLLFDAGSMEVDAVDGQVADFISGSFGFMNSGALAVDLATPAGSNFTKGFRQNASGCVYGTDTTAGTDVYVAGYRVSNVGQLVFEQGVPTAFRDGVGFTATDAIAAVEFGPQGDPDFASVVALLHFDGADGATTFTDVKGHTVTRVGTATLETTGALYGTASMQTLDVVSGCVIDHDDMALGAGEWTIEGVIKLSEIPSNDDDGYGVICAVCADEADTDGVFLYAVPDFVEDPDFGSLSCQTPDSGGLDADDSVIERDQLTNIAITKNASNVITVWVNGVSVVSQALQTSAPTSVDPKFFLGAVGSLVGCKGLWDEWRLTPGVCRYTGPYTPDPPYPDA